MAALAPQPTTVPAPANTGPSLTDQYVSQLATPFSGKDTRTLLAGKEDIIPVGSNIHVEFIGLVFGLFVITLFITGMLGYIFHVYYMNKRNPYTDADDERLKDEFYYTDMQYVGVVASVLSIIAFIIMIVYFSRWIKSYNPTLLKQNAIAKDIAVAMRGGKAVQNVSNLLATSVHPLSNETSEGERNTLSTYLRSGIRNGFRNEMNAERSRLGVGGDTSLRMGQSRPWGRGWDTVQNI